MEIEYKNNKLQKICTLAHVAVKEHGQEMADKIHQRIDEIEASESVEDKIRFRIGRCHALSQNRRGQYAMDLVHPYRLIFTKKEGQIQVVKIIEIDDYH